ncbi:putative uncharacterized protein [Pseudomonas sp. StFLB209]|uniref:hypothetical protein n=1 Tax=Pseudomonas sp. StFLB209 TaxID=1028989 RepID=UPI0004F63839|nr:hypothetical protein [Pseudomonas sp. StFLB209]BAP41566.1 putative uncharacterized protein [Pseudomonas sp. StFLB209]
MQCLDDKAFGGQYQLDLLNIQNTLDFKKLLLSNPEEMRDVFIQQILEKGEKREEPLVDVVA